MFRDVQDPDLHGDERTRCCSTLGGDEGREECCVLREQRDGVPLLTVYQAAQRGGSSFVMKSCQIHLVESIAEVKGQGDGVPRMEEKMTNVVSVVNVGGQLLDIQ